MTAPPALQPEKVERAMRFASVALIPVSSRATLGAVALALMAACSPSSTEAQGTVSRGPASNGAVEMIADDLTFTPDTLELDAGSEVAIQITNKDSMAHDFTIEAFDLTTGNIEAGEIVTVTLTVPQGTTEFRCTIHDISRMGGLIEGR